MSVHKFEFSKNSALQLDVAGHMYNLDVMDIATVKKIQEFDKGAIEKGNALMDRTDYEDAVREACAFCGEAIDSILGEGAYKEIFAGRVVNVLDHIDVLNFITAKVTEFRSERFATYAPNRAVRRGKK